MGNRWASALTDLRCDLSCTTQWEWSSEEYSYDWEAWRSAKVPHLCLHYLRKRWQDLLHQELARVPARVARRGHWYRKQKRAELWHWHLYRSYGSREASWSECRTFKSHGQHRLWLILHDLFGHWQLNKASCHAIRWEHQTHKQMTKRHHTFDLDKY